MAIPWTVSSLVAMRKKRYDDERSNRKYTIRTTTGRSRCRFAYLKAWIVPLYRTQQKLELRAVLSPRSGYIEKAEHLWYTPRYAVHDLVSSVFWPNLGPSVLF